MWSSRDHGPDMTAPNAPPSVPMAEEEANSAFSHDDASSNEDVGTVGSGSAPRKRRRERYQKTSCELCKARKVKCDRAEPACSWCARHNRTCVYLDRQKVGVRPGASIELEAKVNRIDALLQALGRRVEAHIAGDQAAAQQLSPSVSNNSPSHIDGFQQNEGRLSQRSLPAPAPTSQSRSQLYQSPLWQVDNGQGRQPQGQTTAPTQMNILVNDASSFSNAHAHQEISGTSTALSIRTSDPDLPPHYMIYTLVDLYFKHCNTWCPILDRKTTFEKLFGPTSLEESEQVLLYAIIAATLRFLKDPRLSSELRAHYHRVCRHRVQMYAMEHISIPALTALVLVALDELGTSNGPKGWNLLSLLVQNVRQLDLYKETSVYLKAEAQETPNTGSIRRVVVGEPESWIEDEGRRRLCWVVYLLDRYATVATTTFDFMLDDLKMKRILPCSYDNFSRNIPVETSSTPTYANPHDPTEYIVITKPENLGSFSYHCLMMRILSKVHNFLKNPVDITSSADMASWRNTYRTLDGALNEWLQSLPSEYSKISALCHSDPASRVANWFMLHSAYVTCVVRLHSSTAYPAVRSHIFVPSHYAMQKCLSAVQSLGDIAQDVLEANGLDLLGPPFAFALWVAARLLLVHAATVGSLDPRITFFIDTLRHVGQHWEVANNYAKILDRVVLRDRQSGMSLSSMRRSAYDLVTLTSTTRRTGVEQTSTQVTSLSELDNIDVFDFFNYPKVAKSVSASSSGQINILQTPQPAQPTQPTQPSTTNEMSGDATRINGVLNLEPDWLGFGTPFN